jgi:SAM-dependent methyltransferase
MPPMTTSTHREATLARFEEIRQGWSSNRALQALYAYWYAEIGAALNGALPANVIEIGSGPGIIREYLPGIRTSDVVAASWHDHEIDATRAWPIGDGSLDGIVLFDVLHHLSEPRTLFREATRTLRPGGRFVIMEPYVSPFSDPIYRFLHDERSGFDRSVRPFALRPSLDKDPMIGNPALPWLIFGRDLAQFRQEFPSLRVAGRRLYGGFSYLASGGFFRPCLLPLRPWNGLFWLDRHLPKPILPLVAVRMLVILERAPIGAS